jgi:hypothetical protein
MDNFRKANNSIFYVLPLGGLEIFPEAPIFQLSALCANLKLET